MKNDAKNASVIDEVWDKWSQAIAHCSEIIDASVPIDGGEIRAFFPVLVVPNESLWTMDYTSEGDPDGNPTQADEATFFIGKTLRLRWGETNKPFTITHLLIMTESGLRRRVIEISSRTAMANLMIPPSLYDPRLKF
jgi:hypothetical protein